VIASCEAPLGGVRFLVRSCIVALVSVTLSLSCASRSTATLGATPTQDTGDATPNEERSGATRRAVAPEPDARGAATAAAPASDRGQALKVDGFEDAVIVIPAGMKPVPLLVAAHGAGGDPAWECERWARVARGRWFLVCPCGLPLRRGEAGSYYYPEHHTLEREVTAAVLAAREKYGARIATRGGTYVAYSQGATMGALMLVEHGAEFPHLLLIEGGSGDWTRARAERFRATGGESVFIVCGTSGCAGRAARARPVLERAGLAAEVRVIANGGHTELEAVGAAAETLLETLAPQ
jgi:hypothetical protein